jgi:prepilin-type N-terminal cleavage/methylation domain-containing protein
MSRKQGFSLIEVLVSLMLLSFALLGLDAMEVMSLRGNRDAYFFAVAENQLQIMAEKLRVMHSYDVAQQVADWNSLNADVLPQGEGVVRGDFPLYQLQVWWGAEGEKLCEKNQRGQSGCLREDIQFQA